MEPAESWQNRKACQAPSSPAAPLQGRYNPGGAAQPGHPHPFPRATVLPGIDHVDAICMDVTGSKVPEQSSCRRTRPGPGVGPRRVLTM